MDKYTLTKTDNDLWIVADRIDCWQSAPRPEADARDYWTLLMASAEGEAPDEPFTNGHRAARAEEAFLSIREDNGCSTADAVCDLLADLIHLCDREQIDFRDTLHRATMHYWAEIESEIPS